jgi:hypothetical protein
MLKTGYLFCRTLRECSVSFGEGLQVWEEVVRVSVSFRQGNAQFLHNTVG